MPTLLKELPGALVVTVTGGEGGIEEPRVAEDAVRRNQRITPWGRTGAP